MAVKNRFAATDEQQAEEQLIALYGKAIRSGSNREFRMTWCVKNLRATMARASTHRNGKKQPLYIVEVK